MKIFLISGAYPPIKDGVGAYTKRLTEEFLEDDQQVTVLTDDEAEGPRYVQNVIEKWSWSSLGQIKQAIREASPDVIHFQYSSIKFKRRLFINLIPALLNASFKNTPVFVTIHEYQNASRLGRLRVLVTLLGSKAAVVSNDQDLEMIKRWYKRKPVVRIHIGNNIGLVEHSEKSSAQLRKKYHIGNEQLVGFAGFIDPAKGIETLIEAAKLMDPKTSLLFMSGRDHDNPYHQQIEQRIEKSGLKVYWPGFLSDPEVSMLIQEASVMVFPFKDPVSARRSTFITSLIHGAPTISTGSDNDVFVSNQNCILIEDMNPTTLADRLSQLLGDDKQASALSQEARKIDRYFDWKIIAQEHLSLYRGDDRG